jgi:hypothetical protein
MDLVSGTSRLLSYRATRRAVVMLLLAIPLLVVFHPALFGGRVLLPLDQLDTMTLPYSEGYSGASVHNHYLLDAVTQFYPARLALERHWRDGDLAFWNQAIFGGYPQYAQTMGAPFNLTNIVLLAGELPWSYHWQLILQLYIAGLAMYMLLRELAIDRPISLVCAMAYMLNSLFITSLLLPVVVGAFCWAPAVIAGMLRYRRRRDATSLALASAALAAGFLGGSLQTSASLVVMVAIFQLATIVAQKESRSLLRSLLPLLLIVLVAFALSAIMWLPSLELAWLDVQRTGSKFAGKSEPYGIIDRILSIPLLLSFYMPELAGSVRSLDLTKIVGASMEDFTGFAGFAPLLFATLGGPLLWKRNPEARPFIVLALAGLLLPIATPLYSFLYHRFFIVFLLGAVVVAALSLQRFLDDPEFARRLARWIRRAGVAVGILAVGLLLLDIALRLFHDEARSALMSRVMREISSSRMAAGHEAWMISRVDRLFEHFSILSPGIWLPLVCMALVIAVILHYQRRPGRGRMTLVVPIAAVTLLQLTIFARSWLPFSDPGVHPLYPRTAVTDYLDDEGKQAEPFRVLPVNDPVNGESIFQPNILSVYGISTLSGYENVMPVTLSGFATREPDARLLGLLNVRYLIARRDREFVDRGFERVGGDTAAVALYRNTRWRPRAFMAYRYRVESDSAAARSMHAEEFDGSTVIFPVAPPEVSTRGDSSNRVVVREASDNRLVIEVTSGSPGFLVIADNWYPGWRAFVADREVPLVRANVAMKALALPSGYSRVEIRFEPVLFRVGAWVSGVSVLLLLVGTVLSRQRRRTRMNTTPTKSDHGDG